MNTYAPMKMFVLALFACFTPCAGCKAPASPALHETSHWQPAPRSEHGYRRNVAVLVFEGVELLDFAGPVEVFTQTRAWDEPLRVYTVGVDRRPIRTGNVVTVVPDFAVDACPPPDILVIPGGETACLEGDRPLAQFIRDVGPKVEIVFSVCNGVFSLVKAGFLDGKEATTHWTAIGWLREEAPRTIVHADRRFVDNGQVITAAGVSAGIDGALHIVDRLLGRQAARRAARRMEYVWSDEPSESEAEMGRVERARQAWYREDFKSALDDYRAIVAEQPDDSIALTRLGTCLLFTKQTEAALEPLQRAVEIGSAEMRLYHTLGIALARLDRHVEALSMLEKAHSLDPTSVELWHDLGSAQARTGHFREAIPNLMRAHVQGRGGPQLVALLARCQASIGDRAGAIESLKTLAEGEPAELATCLADPAFDSLRADPRVAALLERSHARNAPP